MRRLLVLTLLAVGVRAQASGNVFRYVEKDGTIVYTNVPPAGKNAKKMQGSFSPAPAASEPVTAKASTPADFEPHINTASHRYRIPSSLVRAVMHAESNFNRHAVSPKGASGLMQLMPQTASEMFVKDIFDARENIEGGTRYLRVLANLFRGDMVKMIAAYNAGPEAVRKYGGSVPPYAETQAYVRKVVQLYFQYKEREQGAAPGLREAKIDVDDDAADRPDEQSARD